MLENRHLFNYIILIPEGLHVCTHLKENQLGLSERKGSSLILGTKPENGTAGLREVSGGELKRDIGLL